MVLGPAAPELAFFCRDSAENERQNGVGGSEG
jgi:hypothetical protein